MIYFQELTRQYISNVGEHNTLNISGESFEMFLQKKTSSSSYPSEIHKYAFGMDFNSSDAVTVSYSPVGFHAGPVALTVLLNAILASMRKPANNSILPTNEKLHSIEVFSHPIESSTKV